jgi:hypothetical protein
MDDKDVREMNPAELCAWLTFKVDEATLNKAKHVIREQDIKGIDFIDYSWEMWRNHGLTGGAAISLVRTTKEYSKTRKLNYIQLSPSSFEYQWHEFIASPSSNYLLGRVKPMFRLPVQLLCPIFGQFVKRFQNYQDLKDVSSLVDELCAQMEPHFKSEEDRVTVFHKMFRDIIGKKFNIFLK